MCLLILTCSLFLKLNFPWYCSLLLMCCVIFQFCFVLDICGVCVLCSLIFCLFCSLDLFSSIPLGLALWSCVCHVSFVRVLVVPLSVVKVFAFYIGSAVCFHCLFLFVILFVALSSCILLWCIHTPWMLITQSSRCVPLLFVAVCVLLLLFVVVACSWPCSLLVVLPSCSGVFISSYFPFISVRVQCSLFVFFVLHLDVFIWFRSCSLWLACYLRFIIVVVLSYCVVVKFVYVLVLCSSFLC